MKLPVVSGKEFDRGLLRSLIKDVGISVDEFIRLK